MPIAITTADPDTLAELVTNNLRCGWHLRVGIVGDTLDVEYLRRDGNGLRVQQDGRAPFTIPLEQVVSLHIY